MARVQPMENLVYRSRWGARKPVCKSNLHRPGVKGIAVHYTASGADQVAHRYCAGRVRGIQNYHMDTKGWCDGAYSFVICQHGYIYQMRGWYLRTAANGTNVANSEYLATCFLGSDSVSRDDLTPEAKAAFRRVFARYRVWYNRKPVLRPHSDFTPTSCPGNEIRRWLSTL